MVKRLLAVSAAIVTLIGCRKEQPGEVLPDGMCAVEFRSSGQATVVPVGTKGTSPIGAGTTSRVLAYQRVATSADVLSDVFKSMKTYVAGAAGALSASPVNDNGEVVPGDAQGMELHNGTYDFYAYSPALKIEADNYTVKGIGHYMDFLGAAVPGRAVSRSASDVELTFEHKCSKVRFNVKTVADMSNASLSADSVVLYKMAVSPAADYVLGGDIATTAGTDADTAKLARIEAAEDNKSTSVWDILLPKSSGAFDGKFFLKVDGRRYILSAKNIPAMSFSKATQYIFSAVVQQGSVSLVLDVASWDAVSGDIDAGEGNGAGSGSWEGGAGEAGGSAGGNHGIEIGRWENVDWSGGMGGNPDPVTGAVEVGSWKPAQMLVDAGGSHVADVDSWVKKTLAAQAGGNHGGGVDDWNDNDFQTGMGGVPPTKANCGMVVPGEVIAFDMGDRVTKAKAASGNAALTINWALNTDYTPLVIWTDVAGIVSNVSYDKGKGVVTVVTNGEKGAGNAVVGLFPSGTSNANSGTCLWSWHVWVTGYAPDGTKSYGLGANAAATVDGGQVHTYGNSFTTTNPGKVIMDRNLGAVSALYTYAASAGVNYPTYGLLYQWGRKDPFQKAALGTTANQVSTQATYNISGTATGLPVRASGPVAVSTAVRNPHVFYYNASGTLDWATPSNNALWNSGTNAAPVKSVYDPCPEGWRIATNGTWTDFGSAWGAAFSKAGSWTTYDVTGGGLYAVGGVKAWYPAPGFCDAGSRAGGEGMLWHVGNHGYSWSSTINGTEAIRLGFNASGPFPEISNNRAYGFSVRCIQE